MSVKVTSWVWEHSQARGAARLVLLAIAYHANDERQAWPSVPRLGRETKLTQRSVHRAIAELVKLGELEVASAAGPSRCNLYRVRMTPDSMSPLTESHPRQNDTPDTVAPLTSTTPTPDIHDTLTLTESHPNLELEPSENRKPPPAGRASRATAATVTSITPVTPIPTAQTFVAAYVDAYRGRAGHDPPSRVKGQLAKELGRLCADGIPTDAIKAGFVEWFDRDLHPSVLPSVVEVHARGGQPRASPGAAARQVDQARATYERMMADAPEGTGAAGRPAQLELARPADQRPDR